MENARDSKRQVTAIKLMTQNGKNPEEERENQQ